MSFAPQKAAIRFGEGLSPDVAPPASVEAILTGLQGPDGAASAFPIAKFEALLPEMEKVQKLRREYRRGRNGPDADKLQKAFRKARGSYNRALLKSFAAGLGRSITTEDGFRERLTRFWADHFTVVGRDAITRFAVPHYVEEAIRPNVKGTFADLLTAAVLHPMMLHYLDQTSSVGPNSPVGQRGKRGLNENLARELLELHSVGVDAAYTQKDVRELAELLTGLTANLRDGFAFRPKIVEPGAETILGASFGGEKPNIEDIRTALQFLGTHPATARHIATKLATHFVSDSPSEDLVASIEARFLATDGDLMEVYGALLEQPDSWATFGEKVKQPIDFVASTMRALAAPPKVFENYNRRKLTAYLGGPLAAMGQTWLRPGGPDGWPEEAEAWITPQGLAARLQWALSAPSAVFRGLPDPREFLTTALGDLADERLVFAAKAAETRREGIGLILASPAFQRR